MDPLTVSMEVTDALGSLIDERGDLAVSARETRELIEAKLSYMREAVDDSTVFRRHIELSNASCAACRP